ncbi:hypothetical protein I6J18_00165 (plasmid) [Peribacillus psychrosaccharolyticus]|uniref:Uncharacterized protein n=1 Tax=Peribacillus psychrosaccharolyticus TaxID=1407 RepID=A0A974NIQ8_PERPY|nr:hypothetical protein [Peribacillus psychrosaccharolyticus]MEC2054240.1 hypothetical protein [Peribacillus psychrosaccharolyticus]MED3746591.1 hypothetical protein [Peribacillus psychrosaccharolyticus]QQS98457.1 hypothetical protein I6J18_00165 [Peribacillus psychrosaccharolyticus]
MEEKTSVFSLMEQQASSLPLVVAGSYNLCEFVEKDEKRPRKKEEKNFFEMVRRFQASLRLRRHTKQSEDFQN